ncbi:MAG: nuclear transport factor 2 family protein [Acidobacteriota bacterium]|nr:nuclear transport factor 2 family protein [Acidobacteriota bacterium]
MKKNLVFVSMLIVAAACAAPPTNRETLVANTNPSSESKPAATISEADAIVHEKAAWNAIQNKDYEAFGSMLASEQLEVTSEEVHDKAATLASIKEFEPTEVALVDWKFLLVDKNAFAVTYTANVKGKYNGKELPPGSVRASSLWVNRDGKWLAIYHQECPIKPSTPPPPASKETKTGKASHTPASTTAMPAMGADPIANEQMIWEFLKSKRYDSFGEMLASEAIELEPDGVFDKAGIVKGVSQFDFSKTVLSEFKVVKLDDEAALVTYMVKDPGFAPSGERHSTTWANRNGKWLVVFHHGGTPATKPSAAAVAKPSASLSPKASASPAAKASPSPKASPKI